MRLLSGLVVAFLTLAASLASLASTVTVDCAGGGDFEDLGEAVWSTNADTILVAPCTYHVTDSWWPAPLDSEGPTIIGVGGADVTIIEGDGTLSAFFLFNGELNAHISLHGLTFRGVRKPLWKPDPDTGGLLLLMDNVIEDCAYGFSATWAPSSSLVARNLIRNCGGPALSVYHNNGVIEQNEICYCGSGISQVCCECPRIRQNHVHHNAGFGIATSFTGDVQYNLIEWNGDVGISVYQSGIIEHNVIRYNRIGVHQHNPPMVSLHGNDIYDNEDYNFEASTSTMDRYDFDATMNWWGSTDPEQIAAGIYDCHDDPAVGCCVVFEPWCTQPGCEVTPVRAATWGQLKSLYRQ